MRRIFINNAISRRIRRSQRGQSILLLAFAFIALIAFVGLVTDVALLFVRYAALRRAVDSAAIAAAGQVRESTTYAEVAIAAQQYIELHGLESESILVETCETDIHKWRMGQKPFVKEDGSPDPHPEALYMPVTAHMPETELCDWDDPRKLVRVSAQIKSPTTFLSLLGIEAITLESTSVSETAVIDIALVIDTSESMSKQSDSSDLSLAGLRSNSQNPDGHGGDGTRYWPERCTYDGTEGFKWGGCCNDTGAGFVGDGRKQSNGIVVPNGLIWHDVEPKNGMYDGNIENGVVDNTPLTVDARGNRLGSTAYSPLDEESKELFNFTTLVCDPFKQVKDAARAFVRQLDFVRGDRIVFVTFDQEAIALDPDGDEKLRPLIRDELTAIDTLNKKVGILYNTYGVFNRCKAVEKAGDAWAAWDGNPATRPDRPFSYETVAQCTQTNIGGGILAGNNALTDPIDVRREAVWVMVVLSDGAANVTNPVNGITDKQTYGFYGYCPWNTFCRQSESYNGGAPWPECQINPIEPNEPQLPYCNDDLPDTRHFCLNWETGEQVLTNPECGVAGHYDADDYARDMADFAGLIEVDDGVPGNYIAMFSIAFGAEVINEETGAPLLRYIADAGDNGRIDDDTEQFNRGDPPDEIGDPGPCQNYDGQKMQQCGQYYFAQDLNTLTGVFEDIAGRLFTRLSR